MSRNLSILVAAGLLLAVPAHAESVRSGAAQGAADGRAVAGPLGAAVGGVIGGVVGGTVGGVKGVLGIEQRPRLRSYVVERQVPSYVYLDNVVVGTVLPVEGVTYYEVPAEYGVTTYRYTVVNGRTVLVDPGTRTVVDIIE